MVRWLEYKAKCHICGRMVAVKDTSLGVKPVVLPSPWREVQLLGWVAKFDICGDICEEALRARYERPEIDDDRDTLCDITIEAETVAERDDPTVPTPIPLGWPHGDNDN